MKLTKLERKFAETSAKRANWPIYRHHEKLGWVGCFLFVVGLFRGRIAVLPLWAGEILFYTGFVLLIGSILGLAMSTTGKLYSKLQQAGLDDDTDQSANPRLQANGRYYFLMRIESWISSLPCWAHIFFFPIFLVLLFVIPITAYYLHLKPLPIGMYGNLLVSLLLWVGFIYVIWKVIRWLSRATD